MREDVRLLVGDCREVLPTLDAESVHTVITSPPYYQLRSYLPDESPVKHKEIGSEETPEEYLETLVGVFRQVRRVLRNDGQLWLNMGDSYETGTRASRNPSKTAQHGYWSNPAIDKRVSAGLKPKDLMMMPFRVAIALQDDGWWVRCPITICRNNPMPESVQDRCTSATEMLFMLTKQPSYYYDQDAIREPHTYPVQSKHTWEERKANGEPMRRGISPTVSTTTGGGIGAHPAGRNRRNWWVLNSQPLVGIAHYASFPEKLVEPCLLAGTSEWGVCVECGSPWKRTIQKQDTGRRQKMADGWDTGSGGHGTIHRNGRQKGEGGIPVLENVTTGWEPTCQCETDQVEPAVCLDPFAGSGTVCKVATKLGRRSIGIELNEEYVDIAWKRNAQLGLML